MKVLNFLVQSNDILNVRNNLIKVTPANNETLPEMFPGQFVQILVDNSPNVFLRRPISINFIDKKKNEIWLLIQRVGEGTRKICELNPGEVINLMFPLGNSFTIPNHKGNYLLIGGGVGTAPMLFLGKRINEFGIEPDFLLGGRSATDILQQEEFERYGNLFLTTEDGTVGQKGYVTDHTILKEKNYDYIFTCGPKPMMVSVAKYANTNGIECEVSLENLMACGFGACLCCTEKTVRGNVCSCTEGPVFNIKELTWLD
ncbi:MAG TPA: dihydroorotate dehydrogenase electron transfer subunit [Bacteroidales bacterium]|nr:dihydroorotate dehydrogenase electron transfer subunit [Bacteroidales bacterium]